jgi:hypothetical protein
MRTRHLVPYLMATALVTGVAGILLALLDVPLVAIACALVCFVCEVWGAVVDGCRD